MTPKSRSASFRILSFSALFIMYHSLFLRLSALRRKAHAHCFGGFVAMVTRSCARSPADIGAVLANALDRVFNEARLLKEVAQTMGKSPGRKNSHPQSSASSPAESRHSRPSRTGQ